MQSHSRSQDGSPGSKPGPHSWAPVTFPPWPRDAAELDRVQRELGSAVPLSPRSQVSETGHGFQSVGACFVCFGRGGRGSGARGDRGWAGAALFLDGNLAAAVAAAGEAGESYDPGHLALREGPLLEAALLALPERPEMLLVNATGRDHPRRAGLAVHLGARLDLPSLGVTNRLLVATGAWPPDEPFSRSPLQVESEIVGYWLRTRRGARPVAVHAGWRVDAATAIEIVLACTRAARTPEPLRAARRAAREARERERPAGRI